MILACCVFGHMQPAHWTIKFIFAWFIRCNKGVEFSCESNMLKHIFQFRSTVLKLKLYLYQIAQWKTRADFMRGRLTIRFLEWWAESTKRIHVTLLLIGHIKMLLPDYCLSKPQCSRWILYQNVSRPTTMTQFNSWWKNSRAIASALEWIPEHSQISPLHLEATQRLLSQSEFEIIQ